MATANDTNPGDEQSELGGELPKAALGREQKPPRTSPRLTSFATTGGLYALAPGVDAMDIHDQLAARLGQLRAMLVMIQDDGSELLNRLSPAFQQNYFWACAMLAAESQDLANILLELRS